MASKFLTLADIMAVEDRKPQVIEVPEWGGSVKLRPMSSSVRTQYEAKMYQLTKAGSNKLNNEDWKKLKTGVLAQCLYSGDGTLMFDPNNDAQWEFLGDKNCVVIDRLFEECLKMSGIGAKTEKE